MNMQFFLRMIDSEPNTEIESLYNTLYLGDLQILNNLPVIKLMFLKLYKSFSSSNSVKRLFSMAGKVCIKKTITNK